MIGACVRCNSAGLAYLNNRYHDPTTGTFISVDPLVATTGDPYVYAAGNPTTLTDPDGLEALPGGEWMWEGGGAQTGKAFRDGYYHAMVNLWTDLNHTYRNVRGTR